MDIHKAVQIGLLPEELESKIQILGNSSLKGAVKCCLNENDIMECERIAEMAKEFHLSMDSKFNDLYLQHMFFE
jgi:uncharacterized 2Fe-2S/4Fe-4S cluster protein (DUF4445 family)